MFQLWPIAHKIVHPTNFRPPNCGSGDTAPYNTP